MLGLLKILINKSSITAEEYELLQNAAKVDGEKVEKNTPDLPKTIPTVNLRSPKIIISSSNRSHACRHISLLVMKMTHMRAVIETEQE